MRGFSADPRNRACDGQTPQDHRGPALCFPRPPSPAASLDPTLWSGSRLGPPGPSTERVNVRQMSEQGEGCAGPTRRPRVRAERAPPLPAPILEASADTWLHRGIC